MDAFGDRSASQLGESSTRFETFKFASKPRFADLASSRSIVVGRLDPM